MSDLIETTFIQKHFIANPFCQLNEFDQPKAIAIRKLLDNVSLSDGKAILAAVEYAIGKEAIIGVLSEDAAYCAEIITRASAKSTQE